MTLVRKLAYINFVAGVIDTAFFIVRIQEGNRESAIIWMLIAMWSFTLAFVGFTTPVTKEEK